MRLRIFVQSPSGEKFEVEERISIFEKEVLTFFFNKHCDITSENRGVLIDKHSRHAEIIFWRAGDYELKFHHEGNRCITIKVHCREQHIEATQLNIKVSKPISIMKS